MIDSIRLIGFQDGVECSSLLRNSKESFLCINYEFTKGNTYGLASDFGCGSWGLATCLGGRCTKHYSGKILLNNNEVPAEKLSGYACFIAEKIIPPINTEDNLLTPSACIEKALNLSKQPYSVEQVKELFHLSDGRFDRPLDHVSGEIWFISLAVNFALGKDIFCFPWLNMIEIDRFETACKCGIIKLLRNSGKIVFVPSSQNKTLRKYCSHILNFKKGKIDYR